MKATKAKIKENPRNNIRKIARKLNMDKSAVSMAVRKDSGMKLRAMTKVWGLTANWRQKRLERLRILLRMRILLNEVVSIRQNCLY